MSKICIPWQLLLNAFGYSKTHDSRCDLMSCEMRDERWNELRWIWDLLGWAVFDAGTCWLPVSLLYFGMSNNIPHNCRRRRRRTVCNGNANRGTTYSYCRLESSEREGERRKEGRPDQTRVAAGCSSLHDFQFGYTISLLREASFHISSYTLKIAIGIGAVDGRCAAIR